MENRKIRIRLTPLVHSLNQWVWLAETGLMKEDYFIAHPELAVPSVGCYLCDYLLGTNKKKTVCQVSSVKGCENCPFTTVLGYNCIGDNDSIFIAWIRAQNQEDRRKAAQGMVNFFRRCLEIYALEKNRV